MVPTHKETNIWNGIFFIQNLAEHVRYIQQIGPFK